MMAEQGKITTRTSTKKTTEPVTSATAPTASANRSDRPTTPAPQNVNDEPVRPSRPRPAPRTNVLVNVDVIRNAFVTGDASQSVGYVQHVLRSYDVDPGNVNGVADHATRTALARFQEMIGEVPTGLPTASTLDYLGFDVLD